MRHHHMFSKTGTASTHSKSGMAAYQGGVVAIRVGMSSYFYVSQMSRQTYIETMQPRPFEEWIEKGHQRDANLCGACVRRIRLGFHSLESPKKST